MRSTAKYDLERTTPDGQVKRHGAAKTLREVAVLASHVLFDNCAASKADAQRVAAVLTKTPAGETVTAYGYTFRIVEAA